MYLSLIFFKLIVTLISAAPESSPIAREAPYSHIKAEDVINSFGWREITKDVKNMLTKTRAKILERDYFLIDHVSSAAIRADLEKGDPDSAATTLIEYFENNHNGNDLLRFCTFLNDEAEESRSSALKNLALRIERTVKNIKPSGLCVCPMINVK